MKDAHVEVDRDAVALSSKATVKDLVDLAVLPPTRPWGEENKKAVAMELLVSTLSHALNEDFMLARLHDRLSSDAELFAPRELATWTAGTVSSVFSLAPNSKRKEDPEKLATLVNANFSHFLTTPSEDVVNELLSEDADGGSVARAAAWLREFPVFADDPLQKKSSLFLQRLYMQGYLKSREAGLSVPFAIDRHIVRLALRLGWVRVAAASPLAGKLGTRVHTSRAEDLALRTAVLEALRNVAETSEVAPPVLNFVLWQFGRSYCARYDPACVGNRRLLGRGSEFTLADGPCLFAEECSAFSSGTQLLILDPVHRGGFY